MPKQSAEYFRQYRATKAQMQSVKDQELLKQGINRCAIFLREKIAGRALTGYQLAGIIERSMLETENPELIARQKFIEKMRP